MMRVLIVDDEPLARSGVSARLSAHADCQIVGECSSGQEALEQIKARAPNLLFLDICMPDMTGIELLDSLSIPDIPAVIVLSAHERFALDAFRHEALDYLLKPVDEKRFEAAVARARRLFKLRLIAGTQLVAPLLAPESSGSLPWLDRFSIRSNRKTCVVLAQDILWIEGLGDYVGLHGGGATHLVRTTLSSLERRLDPALFLRIHRSIIVNVAKVQRVTRLTNQDSLVILKSGLKLRASRTYYNFLKNRFFYSRSSR